MAKGGGRGKGRPRKVPEIVIQPQIEFSPTGSERVGSSNVGKLGSNSPQLPEKLVQQLLELEIQALNAKQREDLKVEAEKEAKARKIEEEVVPPLHKRGMNLSYIAPHICQGIPTAKLILSEIEREAAKRKNVVIFYVIGDSPTIAYLKKILQTQCDVEGCFDIFLS